MNIPISTHSPSPSPPPQIPTPLTPGPRAIALKTIYDNALASTLSAITLSSFASCFPTIAKTSPGALKSMHGGLISRLETFAKDEFEKILVERKAVERLNTLEDVISDGKRSKSRSVEGEMAPVAPHTLPPPDLLSAYLSPIYTQQQSHLNAKMQTIASQNAALAEEIAKQKAEIDRMMAIVEILVRDLEGTLRGMEDAGVERLAKGGREVDAVLST